MNTNHTPGPWTARQSYSNESPPRPEMMDFHCSVDCNAPFTDDIPESDQFGQTFEEQACARAFGRTLDEMRANARLIAAAPDLLAALKRCAKSLELYGQPSAIGSLSQARAAIAKAKGQA